jgi:hypothetical protein
MSITTIAPKFKPNQGLACRETIDKEKLIRDNEFSTEANHKVGIVSINCSCLKIYEFVPANQEEDDEFSRVP